MIRSSPRTPTLAHDCSRREQRALSSEVIIQARDGEPGRRRGTPPPLNGCHVPRADVDSHGGPKDGGTSVEKEGHVTRHVERSGSECPGRNHLHPPRRSRSSVSVTLSELLTSSHPISRVDACRRHDFAASNQNGQLGTGVVSNGELME